ncbi:Sulfate/thiosulfate import ATP-binding protein CysA [Clostridium bornimense]|uniref:ABC-type quaternary amine transporter n=1 Tax=Clostridium bornimense TaxID=1216932 RepID=W6S6C2_9CLOT|nr:sulfate ABC transporter ATP-binding protein [Clostridium bornimense]CDM69907.1 Sulfate/thiosulfate import ATP-binding protein CysA [Clostridium bornimense]
MYVELKNINKGFENYKASDNVNFQIEKGKLIALLGPSGSGKTTILRMIAGLETPDSGDIIIDGVRVNDVEASKRGIGFVFQNYALFRYMTVFDNIAFGLEVQKKDKKFINERVKELISLIGLEGLEKRYPHQLSGGQRQRVAFARALAPNPQLLLLDEPFAAIDAKVRHELRTWLREMIDKVGVTSIFVTHDQDEAIEVADEIIVTNKGRVEQKGTPLEIYNKPATPFVAKFIGQSIVINDFGKLRGFDEYSHYSKAVIRPEFIKVLKKGAINQHISATEEGVVEAVAYRGSYLEVKVRIGDISVTTTVQLSEELVEVGEKVQVLIYKLYAFNNEEVILIKNRKMENNNSVYI